LFNLIFLYILDPIGDFIKNIEALHSIKPVSTIDIFKVFCTVSNNICISTNFVYYQFSYLLRFLKELPMKTEEGPPIKEVKSKGFSIKTFFFGFSFGEFIAILTILFLVYAVLHDIVCKYAN